jgi:hypothetical protein
MKINRKLLGIYKMASADGFRSALRHIQITEDNVLVATDAYGLIAVKAGPEPGEEEHQAILLPVELAKAILSQTTDRDIYIETTDLGVNVSGKRNHNIFVSIGSGKDVVGEFPNYRKAVNKYLGEEPTACVTCNPTLLGNLLLLIGELAGDPSAVSIQVMPGPCDPILLHAETSAGEPIIGILMPVTADIAPHKLPANEAWIKEIMAAGETNREVVEA